MKNKLLTASLIASAAFLAISSTQATSPTFTPTPVAQVDLNKYAGKWYEIARLPMYFQRNCASDVTATYSLKTNGNIKVDNQCMGKDGKMMQSIGEATKNGDSGSKLKVTFLPKALRWLPFGKANYWILKLDDRYQYALVGTPNQEYLWVLSRTPTMPDNLYNDYIYFAKQQGYDVSKLQKTVQTPAK